MGFVHADGKRGKRTRAEFAKPYMLRWCSVRYRIKTLVKEGIAASFGDLTRDAEHAYMETKGIDQDEFLDRYLPPDNEPLPACLR